MRHFDVSPFHRSTIGFDRLFALLDQAAGQDSASQSYPPYNIERTSENGYRITLAVAGFREDELMIETAENALLVKGEKTAGDDAHGLQVLHRGIAARGFQRRFQLADHVRVSGAQLSHGLLHVDLVREIPDAMKPRIIPIRSQELEARPQPQVIETMAEAA